MLSGACGPSKRVGGLGEVDAPGPRRSEGVESRDAKASPPEGLRGGVMDAPDAECDWAASAVESTSNASSRARGGDEGTFPGSLMGLPARPLGPRANRHLLSGLVFFS